MQLFNQSCRVCHTKPQVTSPLYGPELSRASAGGDEQVMRELKREAARQGRTMSELVETALHGRAPHVVRARPRPDAERRMLEEEGFILPMERETRVEAG